MSTNTSGSLHDVMYKHQESIYQHVKNVTSDIQGCLIAPKEYWVRRINETRSRYPSYFADAVMDCWNCNQTIGNIFFNGTI